METTRASITWPGTDIDVLRLFAEPMPANWETDPGDSGEIALFLAIDANDQETGEVVGVEVVGFLEFDRWNDLPDVPLLWQVPGWDPLPLEQLLRRVQQELLAESGVLAPTAG